MIRQLDLRNDFWATGQSNKLVKVRVYSCFEKIFLLISVLLHRSAICVVSGVLVLILLVLLVYSQLVSASRVDHFLYDLWVKFSHKRKVLFLTRTHHRFRLWFGSRRRDALSLFKNRPLMEISFCRCVLFVCFRISHCFVTYVNFLLRLQPAGRIKKTSRVECDAHIQSRHYSSIHFSAL